MIASLDQGFYNGSSKMDLKTDPEQLTKGMLCILKPRYIPCVFLKALSEGEKGESLVMSFK